MDSSSDKLAQHKEVALPELEENMIQVYKRPFDLPQESLEKPMAVDCKKFVNAKHFLQKFYKLEDMREDYLQRQL